MPSNEYYDSSGAPSTGSSLSSSVVRAEFDAVEEGFKKLPTLAGHAAEIVFVNSGGSALESKTAAEALAALGAEDSTNKDASGGYVGLTLFKINFKNALNTITSFFTNANTSARTYTFQDRNGTIADDTDLALKAPLASPTLTGTPSAPTAALNTATTQIATTEFVNNAFVFDESTQGYLRLPGGIVFQWGSASCHATIGNPVAVTFPLAFGTLIGIAAMGVASTTANAAVWSSDRTATGFNIRAALANQGAMWIAVGYIAPA